MTIKKPIRKIFSFCILMNNQFIITWYDNLTEYKTMEATLVKRYPQLIISKEKTKTGFTHYHALVSTGKMEYAKISSERKYFSRKFKTDKHNFNITGVDNYYLALDYIKKDGCITYTTPTQTYKEFVLS